MRKTRQEMHQMRREKKESFCQVCGWGDRALSPRTIAGIKMMVCPRHEKHSDKKCLQLQEEYKALVIAAGEFAESAPEIIAIAGDFARPARKRKRKK